MISSDIQQGLEFMPGQARIAELRTKRGETTHDREPCLQHLMKVNKTSQTQLELLHEERSTFEKECIKLKAGLACMEAEKRSRDLVFQQHEEELVGLKEVVGKLLVDSPSLAVDISLTLLNRENTSRKVLISQLSAEFSQHREVIIDLKSTIERQNRAIDIQKSIIEGQVKTIDDQKWTIDEQRKLPGANNGPPSGQPRATDTTSIDATSLPGEPVGTKYWEQMASSRKRKQSNTSPEESVSDVPSNAPKPRRRPRQNAISHANGASSSRPESPR